MTDLRTRAHLTVAALDLAASWAILWVASAARSRSVQRRLAYHLDPGVRRMLTGVPTSPAIQQILAHDPAVPVRRALASSPIPVCATALTLLATDPDPRVRADVAARPAPLPPVVAGVLASDPDEGVRAALAART